MNVGREVGCKNMRPLGFWGGKITIFQCGKCLPDCSNCLIQCITPLSGCFGNLTNVYFKSLELLEICSQLYLCSLLSGNPWVTALENLRKCTLTNAYFKNLLKIKSSNSASEIKMSRGSSAEAHEIFNG